jgi:hypothetical protein
MNKIGDGLQILTLQGRRKKKKVWHNEMKQSYLVVENTFFPIRQYSH